jgi:hypothetical protein
MQCHERAAVLAGEQRREESAGCVKNGVTGGEMHAGTSSDDRVIWRHGFPTSMPLGTKLGVSNTVGMPGLHLSTYSSH